MEGVRWRFALDEPNPAQLKGFLALHQGDAASTHWHNEHQAPLPLRNPKNPHSSNMTTPGTRTQR